MLFVHIDRVGSLSCFCSCMLNVLIGFCHPFSILVLSLHRKSICPQPHHTETAHWKQQSGKGGGEEDFWAGCILIFQRKVGLHSSRGLQVSACRPKDNTLKWFELKWPLQFQHTWGSNSSASLSLWHARSLKAFKFVTHGLKSSIDSRIKIRKMEGALKRSSELPHPRSTDAPH